MPNPIRTWRTLRGLSLQQLAVAAGTSKSQIDKLERGERRLTVEWMIRLARALACDPRDLLPTRALKSPSPLEGEEAKTWAYASKPLVFAGGGSSSSKHKKKESLPLTQPYGEPRPVRQSAKRDGGTPSPEPRVPNPEFPLPVYAEHLGLAEAIDQTPRPPHLAHVKDAYALYVTNSSMAPMYRPRQLLFIHPYKPPCPGGGVVIVKKNGTILIREFVAQKPNAVTVRMHAPRPRTLSISLKDIEKIHAIVGAMEPQ